MSSQRENRQKIYRNPAKQIASRFDVYVNETECMDCFVYSCQIYSFTSVYCRFVSFYCIGVLTLSNRFYPIFFVFIVLVCLRFSRRRGFISRFFLLPLFSALGFCYMLKREQEKNVNEIFHKDFFHNFPSVCLVLLLCLYT